jgi:sorting nexin-41/42
MSSTAFEDEPNPFQSEDALTEEYNSTTPSAGRLDLDDGSDNEPQASNESQTTIHQSSQSAPSSPTASQHAQSAQQASFPVPQHSYANKEEFCCARDQYLHSGDEVEILVSIPTLPRFRVLVHANIM